MQALAAMSIPVGVTVAGGLAATWWKPSARVRSWLQHFAAGVVTAALAVEMLPEIEAKHPPIFIALGGFGLGGALMFALKWIFVRLEERRAHTGQPQRPVGLFVATGIDVFVDGLVIGMGFASSAEAGFALAIGLSAEMLFLGLAIATELGRASSPWMPLALTSGLALLLFGGAVLGKFGFGGSDQGTVAGGLAFGAAALLYLVTEELLVEAHERGHEGPVGSAMLSVGFLLFWAIRYFFS